MDTCVDHLAANERREQLRVHEMFMQESESRAPRIGLQTLLNNGSNNLTQLLWKQPFTPDCLPYQAVVFRKSLKGG